MAVCAPHREGAPYRFTVKQTVHRVSDEGDQPAGRGPTDPCRIATIRTEIADIGRSPVCRRSSVVERVIGNDEVDSSILSGGTSFFSYFLKSHLDSKALPRKGCYTCAREGEDGRPPQADDGFRPLSGRANAGISAMHKGDMAMTVEEFGDLVGKVVAYAIGIPLILFSLLVAYWLVVTILRLTGVIELPDPIQWLPNEWTKDLPIPK